MNAPQITINGKAYPCVPTMGAMLRFKRETGREITDIVLTDLSDMTTYLWCCVCSAANREGTPLGMDLMTFADNLDPEDMAAWAQTLADGNAGEEHAEKGEKKSPTA